MARKRTTLQRPPAMPCKTKRRVTRRMESLRTKRSVARLLTNPRSPLATADVRSILCTDAAWHALDAADQAQVLALLPDKHHVVAADTPRARPDPATLQSDEGFRASCAAYAENLAAGRHQDAWLAEAWTSHLRRAAGAFDAHLHDRFQHDWMEASGAPTDASTDGTPRPRASYRDAATQC